MSRVSSRRGVGADPFLTRPAHTGPKSLDPSSRSSTPRRFRKPSSSSTETCTATVPRSLPTRVPRPGCLRGRSRRVRSASTYPSPSHSPCSAGAGTREASSADTACTGNCESAVIIPPPCARRLTLGTSGGSTFGRRTRRSLRSGSRKTRSTLGPTSRCRRCDESRRSVYRWWKRWKNKQNGTGELVVCKISHEGEAWVVWLAVDTTTCCY